MSESDEGAGRATAVPSGGADPLVELRRRLRGLGARASEEAHAQLDAMTGLLDRGIRERERTEVMLQRSNRLLRTLRQAQSEFILDASPQRMFETLLATLLELTDSEHGFIGEVRHDESGRPYLKTHAITDISWNEESRALYEAHLARGLEFRNLDTLFGAVLTSRRPLIANDPPTDLVAGGRPP